MAHPTVRRGRRRVLPLSAVRAWNPCADQYRRVVALADADGDIPLTRATFRKALTLDLDWAWLADRLGVDTVQAQADHDAAVAQAGAAYRATIAQVWVACDATAAGAPAWVAYKAAVATSWAALDAAVAESCFRFLVEGAQ